MTVRTDSLCGVLLDVSGSMRRAYAIDQSHDARVERTHAIFTSIVNIVKREVVRHHRREIIFVSAFGLSNEETETCDLLILLDLLRNCPDDGYSALIYLAEKEGVTDRITRWIDEIKANLSSVEARLLYSILERRRELIHELSDLIPSSLESAALKGGAGLYQDGGKILDNAVQLLTLGLVKKDYEKKAQEKVNEKITNSRAYKRAQEIIRDAVCPLAPKPIQYVSQLLDDVFSVRTTADPSEMVHEKIQEFIEVIKPFIFGYTPMCKALSNAMFIFRENNFKKQKEILFILSDGVASDGDPRPIAEELRSMGVVIVTCFLTSDSIRNPKMLYDKMHVFPSSWSRDGRNVLFEMSSVVENTQPPISNLVDANWELPLSGESCLFFQANSLDVVNEFCETVISQMTASCDALVDLIKKVDLATLINQKNAQFKAREQELETCYANAIAAVFYLAMHRIIGREDHPEFNDIRECIIDEYGYEGANTEKVLKNVGEEYCLHIDEVDENGARRAINMRRPVVARFIWYGEEREKFEEFFKNNPKGILKKDCLRGISRNRISGHAVVLMRCSPRGLTFMNSWGEDFANGGFFTLENEHVFSNTITFYDVNWLEADLKPSEKEAYKNECTERCKELGQNFPSVLDLPFICPNCNEESRIGDFSGHALNAKCPKCSQSFKPKNKELIESLYIQAHKPVQH